LIVFGVVMIFSAVELFFYRPTFFFACFMIPMMFMFIIAVYFQVLYVEALFPQFHANIKNSRYKPIYQEHYVIDTARYNIVVEVLQTRKNKRVERGETGRALTSINTNENDNLLDSDNMDANEKLVRLWFLTVSVKRPFNLYILNELVQK